jgi:peptidyl-prolyl cis-trans isomerase D
VLDEALRQPANKLPSWSVVDLGADGVVLMRVNKVLPLEISPQELRETRNQFGSYWAKAEEDAYYRALKRAQKVRFLNDGAKVMDATKADSQQAAASAASR